MDFLFNNSIAAVARHMKPESKETNYYVLPFSPNKPCAEVHIFLFLFREVHIFLVRRARQQGIPKLRINYQIINHLMNILLERCVVFSVVLL
jgi:hypothetical protein